MQEFPLLCPCMYPLYILEVRYHGGVVGWLLPAPGLPLHETAPRPLHQRLGIQSSVRASMYLYTTPAEIDALIEGLTAALRFFRIPLGGGS